MFCALRKLFAYILRINKYVRSILFLADGISDEENVDAELLWNLEILSEIVRCSGNELLPYIRELEKVISLTIGLKCKKAYSRGAKV